MAQVIGGISLNNDDSVTWTDKITKGYFTGDVGKITGGEVHSASLDNTNEAYYYGIAKDNTTGSVQFDVAYGSVNGYGSDTDSGGIPGKSKAVYKQWASTLLGPTEITGGFFISRNSGLDSAPTGSALAAGDNTTGKDDHIYVLVAKRALFKDRLNKKAWTLQLSGSNYSGSGVTLKLTDEHKDKSREQLEAMIKASELEKEIAAKNEEIKKQKEEALALVGGESSFIGPLLPDGSRGGEDSPELEELRKIASGVETAEEKGERLRREKNKAI